MEEDVASERSHPDLPNVAGFIFDCAKAQIHVQINTYRKGLLRSAELGELEGSEVGGGLKYVRVPLHEQFRTRKILQVEQNGARRSITLKALWSNREYARPGRARTLSSRFKAGAVLHASYHAPPSHPPPVSLLLHPPSTSLFPKSTQLTLLSGSTQILTVLRITSRCATGTRDSIYRIALQATLCSHSSRDDPVTA